MKAQARTIIGHSIGTQLNIIHEVEPQADAMQVGQVISGLAHHCKNSSPIPLSPPV